MIFYSAENVALIHFYFGINMTSYILSVLQMIFIKVLLLLFNSDYYTGIAIVKLVCLLGQ